MRLRSLVLLFLAVLSLSLDASPRRRAAGKGAAFDESTPGGWLAANAHVITTAELVPYTGDLQPLRAMIGEADVVGLGDTTHGTHEFFAFKLRAIDMLVREAGFDVVALEGPFTVMNRLDEYVQGGAGDPRAMLYGIRDLYYFWSSEEVVAVVEWMREYNAHRGGKPAIHIAGFDVFEVYPATREVITYLRSVDPPAADTAETQYSCVTVSTQFIETSCAETAIQVRDALAAREEELTAKSSAAAFHEALQHARVVVQNRFSFGPQRDDNLAQNALWLREHRGTARKVILWGHNLHFSKTETIWIGPAPMGRLLSASLGDEYFSVATATAAGSYLRQDARTKALLTSTWGPLMADSYEGYFRQRGEPFLLIPLRGATPSWLRTGRYNFAGTVSPPMHAIESLPEHYDAVIYMDTTTPIHPITP
jgi:erythromycin esterase